MKKHTNIYFTWFGYGEQDFIKCEIPNCNRRAVDIHHMTPRGMGGSKKLDYVENLIALCREHHEEAEAKNIPEKILRGIHKENMLHHKEKEEMIYRYSRRDAFRPLG